MIQPPCPLLKNILQHRIRVRVLITKWSLKCKNEVIWQVIVRVMVLKWPSRPVGLLFSEVLCRSLPLALQLISTNYIHIAITTARRKKLWLWFFVKILLTWFLYSQNSPSSTSLHSLPAIFFSVSELLKLLKFDNRLSVNLIRNTYIRIFCMCKENSSWWKNSPSTNAMQQLLILLYFILP